MWLPIRLFGSSLESQIQPIPGFGDFVSVIKSVPARKSNSNFLHQLIIHLLNILQSKSCLNVLRMQQMKLIRNKC